MADSSSLSAYSDSCQRMANAYIEGSTRFGSFDVKRLRESSQIRRFHINITHTLHVTTDSQTHRGRVNPGANDAYAESSPRNDQLVSGLVQEEESRRETLTELVNSLRSARYASIASRTLLRTNPRQVYFTYLCTNCGGAGRVTCSRCSGRGRESCSTCGGGGRRTCSSCGGSSRIAYTVTKTDGYGNQRTETEYRHCSSCLAGTVMCYACTGSGQQTCSSCSGSGRVVCGSCGGTGCFTRITSVRTYTEPAFSSSYPEDSPGYVHEALQRVGFQAVEQHGDVRYAREYFYPDGRSAVLVYEVTIPFCELDLEIKGHQSAWILFGTRNTIHDSGGILEKLLEDDFKKLMTVMESKERMRPWFCAEARKVVAPFLESEVHQELLVASGQGQEPERIRETLVRSVSQGYIEKSLQELGKVVNVLRLWIMLPCFLLTALLTLPARIALVLAWGGIDTAATSTAKNALYLDYPPSPWATSLLGIAVALFGWCLTRWSLSGCLAYTGGSFFSRWAKEKRLLPQWRTALVFVVLITALSFVVEANLAVWLDAQGGLYGTIPVPVGIELPELHH